MANAFKPAGYNSLSPYLIVRDAAGTIDFLKATFAAVELSRHTNDGGGIMHAEVKVDDTIIMLGDAADGWPAVDAHIHVYVADVDAVYAKALAAGGTAIQEPIRKGDNDKRGGVRDPFGTTWWLATKVA